MQFFKNNEKSVYVESYGCTANKFDLEIMLALLMNNGYHIVNDAMEAEILLINTCAVKTPTESRMLWRLHVLSRLKKPLIIAGCLPRINLPAIRKVTPAFSAALDSHSVDKILEAVRYGERGEVNRLFFSDKPTLKLAHPKVRLNRLVEIVQIAEGCVGACAFCCVRFARGRLFSYPEEMIVERVRKAVHEDAREVWITSQDNGAYGLDIKTDLPDLLTELCEIEGEFLIRVGMMNPAYVMRMASQLIKTYNDEKVFKFLHLSLQSGDDKTLKRMNRFYSVGDFRNIIRMFRSDIPKMTLATDVICGFPGESRDAFDRTLRFIEETKPDIVNISRFFTRPGTPAERMNQLPIKEVKDRSRRMTKLVGKISLERNKTWVGWKGTVLIDERGKKESWIGRNFAYKPIIIKGEKDFFGKFIHARVVKAHRTYLEAEVT